MEQFERFAQPELFVEESDIAPIIIKYADFNEVRHNEKMTLYLKMLLRTTKAYITVYSLMMESRKVRMLVLSF